MRSELLDLATLAISGNRTSLTMLAPSSLFGHTSFFSPKRVFLFRFFLVRFSQHRRPRLVCNLSDGFSPTQHLFESKLRPWLLLQTPTVYLGRGSQHCYEINWQMWLDISGVRVDPMVSPAAILTTT